MSVNQLVLNLKENNEDFEFYPTSKEMLYLIYPHIKNSTVLDIGCGTCNFKKYFEEYAKNKADKFNQEKEREKAEKEKSGERYYYTPASMQDYYEIRKYYVMEKSRILLNNLDEDTICLGTDFNCQTLIDKKVDVIFCNPPYSEFTQWVNKIISEGNYKHAFLVIPQRWKDNVETQNLLKYYKTDYEILGSFDFLEADRQARAKVDIVKFTKQRYKDRYSYCYDRQDAFDPDAFNGFFNKTFNIQEKEEQEEKHETDYDKARRKSKEQDDKVSSALSQRGERSKAQVLVNLYQDEMDRLIEHLRLIMQLDEEVLETFGFSVAKVKEGLKQKITGLKDFYWRKIFDEMEEITDRLTYKSRDSLMSSFEELKTLDFTIDNIYTLILWVIKNANKYFNSQLVDFFVNLSDRENVRPYKSNQKLFDMDDWRWNKNKQSHYVLDYRIIMSSPFRTSWSGQLEVEYSTNRTLLDIKTIANNLGFETLAWNNYPSDFGEKAYVYNKKGEDVFMEYKVYKNGNMHVKFNKEFTKAMNVEVSRLLGWIRTKEDIEKEFPAEMAKGAEKYFKTNNFISLTNNNLLLLENKAA